MFATRSHEQAARAVCRVIPVAGGIVQRLVDFGTPAVSPTIKTNGPAPPSPSDLPIRGRPGEPQPINGSDEQIFGAK